MASDDVLFQIKLTVNQTGGEAEAEIVAVTPQTVLVRIDPNTPWDSEALHHLGVALEVVAKTLPVKRAEG